MKQALRYSIISCLVLVTIFGGAQTKPPQRPADPVLNFRLSLPQASQLIYAIRYSSILDAKSANELADLLVNQSQDTVLNKSLMLQQPQKPKNK